MSHSLLKRRFIIQVGNRDVRQDIHSFFLELEALLLFPGMGNILFGAVMELISNAEKALLKRAYFQKNNLDIHNPRVYKEGLKNFVEEYQSILASEYPALLKKQNRKITLETDVTGERILIFVRSNIGLLKEEEKRIRTRLRAVEKSGGVHDFYRKFADDSESKGLGLAMVVFFLIELGFESKNFRIYEENGETIARLDLPLIEQYRTIRDGKRAAARLRANKTRKGNITTTTSAPLNSQDGPLALK